MSHDYGDYYGDYYDAAKKDGEVIQGKSGGQIDVFARGSSELNASGRSTDAVLLELLATFTEWARQVAGRPDVPRGIRSAAANLHDDGKRLLSRATTANAEAAPDLLRALQGMCSVWQTVCDSKGWSPEHVTQYADARAAIARATGRNG